MLVISCLVAAVLPVLGAAQNQQPLYSTYSFNPLEHLAGISPYFEPQDPPRSADPPQGCQVTKAAYLVRHAAINANDFDYETYLEPITQKLKNTTVDWSKIPDLSFLSTWSPPDLSEQEQLTRTGKLEAAQLGVQLSYRYNNLRLPKRVWASDGERTIESAKGLIRGLEMEDNQIELVGIYEGKQAGANSLTPHQSCPRYSSSYGSKQSSQYVKKYTTPILARLHSMAPSFNWTSDDVVGMFEWCGYETVVRGRSPFCNLELLTPDEWLQFEYAQDIMYHYNVGYATEVSGVMGYPWLNSTLSILDNPPANDDQDVYVSFAHRELPPAVLVAMGLFNNSAATGANDPNATMPLDRVNYHRSWQSSHILPFLSNIAVEKMNCSASFGFENATDKTYYRILVNQSPQTIPECTDGPGESCSESKMKGYVQERGGMFGRFSEQCATTNDNSTDVLSIYSNELNGTMVGRRWNVGRM